MTTWHEYVQQHGMIPDWPYPVRYGSERVIHTDVLVLGVQIRVLRRRGGRPGARP